MGNLILKAFFFGSDFRVERPYGSYDEKQDDISAYMLFRDEIKREDELVEKRFTSFLSLQALLVAAMGVMLSNGIDETVKTWKELVILRQNFFWSVSLIGIFSSALAFVGIAAARMAIGNVIIGRDKNKSQGIVYDIPGYPPCHGSGLSYLFGAVYSLLTTFSFALFWLFSMLFFQQVVVHGNFPPWSKKILETSSKDESNLKIKDEDIKIADKLKIIPWCKTEGDYSKISVPLDSEEKSNTNNHRVSIVHKSKNFSVINKYNEACSSDTEFRNISNQAEPLLTSDK